MVCVPITPFTVARVPIAIGVRSQGDVGKTTSAVSDAARANGDFSDKANAGTSTACAAGGGTIVKHKTKAPPSL